MSKHDWLRTFDECLQIPDESHLIRATVSFDFRPAAGGLGLVPDLTERMRAARGYPDFMRLMARTATGYPVALGFRGQLAVEKSGPGAGRLDLKRGAIIPIVNLVRFHALANGVTISPTQDRIEAVAGVGAIDRALADALSESFSLITRVRFEHHAALIAAGAAAGQPDRSRCIAADRARRSARIAAGRAARPEAPRGVDAGREVVVNAVLNARLWRATTFARESVLVDAIGGASGTLYAQQHVRDSRSLHEIGCASRAAWRASRRGCSSQLSDRGPDSAGVAFYRDPAPGRLVQGLAALAVRRPALGCGRRRARRHLRPRLAAERARHARHVRDRHRGRGCPGLAVRAPPRADADERRALDRDLQGGGPRRWSSCGASRSTEIGGSHALGHTRMATESRVTTEHSHPFSTGPRPVPRAQRLAVEPQPPAPHRSPARASASAPTATARWRPAI